MSSCSWAFTRTFTSPSPAKLNVKLRPSPAAFSSVARMASYRSYRDANSRQFMQGLGLDVSDDGVYPESTRAYIELVGRVNCALAARFECVCELVCGIPLIVKGELPIEITNTLEVEAQQ